MRYWYFIKHSFHIIERRKLRLNIAIVALPVPARLKHFLTSNGRYCGILHGIMCYLTSTILYLLASQKFLAPISVPIYQPLNGMAGNSRPPQSNAIEDTAGSAYHLRPRSANQGCLSGEEKNNKHS